MNNLQEELQVLEKLRDEGDHGRLIERLQKIATREITDEKVLLRIKYFKLLLDSRRGDYSTIIYKANELLQLAEKCECVKTLVDLHLLKAFCYWRLDDSIDSFNELEIARTLLYFWEDTEEKKHYRMYEIRLREASTYITEGRLVFGEKKLAELKAEMEKRQDTHLSTYALVVNNLGRANQLIGNYKKSLGYNLQALRLNKERQDEYGEVLALDNIGMDYYYRGDYLKSLSYLLEAYYKKKINEITFSQAITEINLAKTYIAMNEFDAAFRFLKSAESIFIKEKGPYELLDTYYTYFLFYYAKNLPEQAREYLNLFINCLHDFSISRPGVMAHVAIMDIKLKLLDNRPSTRFSVLPIMRDYLENKDVNYNIRIEFLFMKIKLLLYEYSISYIKSILDEVQEILEKVINLTKRAEAYRDLIIAYTLRAKLMGLSGNFKEMDKNFLLAMDIAEEHGLNRLAVKISAEYDSLLNKINQRMKSSAEHELSAQDVTDLLVETFYHERNEFAIRDRKEEPCLLLITNTSGLKIYSYAFNKECVHLDDDLISSMFSTLQLFIAQAFQGRGHVKRIIHENYYFLINNVKEMTFIYVIKNSSYLALLKLKQFSQEIMNDPKLSAYMKGFKQGDYVIVPYEVTQRIDEIRKQVFGFELHD